MRYPDEEEIEHLEERMVQVVANFHAVNDELNFSVEDNPFFNELVDLVDRRWAQALDLLGKEDY